MPSEILMTIAEVSAAFVGFSMVVSVLRTETPDAQRRFFAIRDVAEIGLIAVGGSMAPLAAELFWGVGPGLWRACSVGLSAFWLLGVTRSMLRYRRTGPLGMAVRTNNAPLAVTFVSIASGNALLWWNALSPSDASGARYVAALLLLLAVAAIFFMAATFRSPDTPAS